MLAFAAQSALDPAIAPFEGRYRYASKLGDWSAPFNDLALGIQSAGQAYLLSMIGTAITKGHLTLAERAGKRALELVPNWKLRQLLAQLDRTKTD